MSKIKGRAVADPRYGSLVSKEKVWIKVCNP
ncbi:unnamed protein product, partial [marine sediment metagenome]